MSKRISTRFKDVASDEAIHPGQRCFGAEPWAAGLILQALPESTRRSLACTCTGEGLVMNATIKYGFAILVVALLINPLGAWAAWAEAPMSPAHPCCPAPSQYGCVCGSTAPAPAAVPSTGNDSQPITVPVSGDVYQAHTPLHHFTADWLWFFASNHLFIALHQFLI